MGFLVLPWKKWHFAPFCPGIMLPRLQRQKQIFSHLRICAVNDQKNTPKSNLKTPDITWNPNPLPLLIMNHRARWVQPACFWNKCSTALPSQHWKWDKASSLYSTVQLWPRELGHALELFAWINHPKNIYGRKIYSEPWTRSHVLMDPRVFSLQPTHKLS